MKILITTEWYRPVVNGVVISVVNLEEELRRQGHQVRVLTLSDNLRSRREGDIYYISSFSVGKVYPDARASVRLHHPYVRELMEWKPDLIHTQCEFSTWIFARRLAKRLGVPMVHTYHTIYEDYTHYFSPSKRLGRWAVAWYSRRVLRSAEAVIVPTAKVEDLLVEYGVRTKIYQVPTGIDLSRFRRRLSPEEREGMREELGLTGERPVIVTVGRLAKEKNIQEILRMLADSRGKNYHFLIVGDGPHRHVLEQLTGRLSVADRVTFTGMVRPEQVAQYYQLGDVFVSASCSETQGLTYVEALACGLPAICKKDPCLKGVILDGENGWQYTGRDSFYRALDDLFSSPESYRRMADCADNHANLFSKEHFGRRVSEIYQEVIEKYEQDKTLSVQNMGKSNYRLRDLAVSALRFVRHP